MLDEGKNTLAQLDPENISSGKNYTYYETDDWSYKLEVVTTLDINKNGKDDWVIWLSDESKTGNYKSYQTLVSYDVPASGIFKAQKYN